MTATRFLAALGTVVAIAAVSPSAADAQGRQGGGRAPAAGAPSRQGGARPPAVVGRAAPRPGPAQGYRPPPVGGSGPYRAYGYGPYRPYYGYAPYYRPYYGYGPGYGPGLSFSFGFGYGYPAYGAYGLYYGYGGGPYPYGYASAPGYVVVPGAAYGGVRIDLPQRDAQVFVDSYYAGIVNNFDGTLQHLDLTPGPHHLEVRAEGFDPIQFDVNVQAGQNITYSADMNPARP